jgi:hypothetical protein
MALAWSTAAGSLGIITERITVDIPLTVTTTTSHPIEYTLISGNLPRGLRLYNNRIVGSPVEVVRFTTSRFVIRATDSVDVEDRTFSLSVDGSDVPQWLTQDGFLNVGPQEAYYVLDNAYVDFQLEVYDPDVIAGDVLSFYLIPTGGQLPPGLSLTKDGRIFGFTDPIFSVEYNYFTSGSYDTFPYDNIPLDFVDAKSNGYDSFFYDDTTYDYSLVSRVPRRLSRIYTFAIAVTDGANTVNRAFKIYVVTEEFLKSDNSLLQVDTNLFQADADSRRIPLWITESYLGRYRANNYLTVFLEVYHPTSLEGYLSHFLSQPTANWQPTTGYTTDTIVRYINSLGQNRGNWICIADHTSITGIGPDVDPAHWSEYGLPPGMTLDQLTGEIAGRIPYQTRISKTYTFRIQAVNFNVTELSSNYNLRGEWSSTTIYYPNDAVRYDGFVYICLVINKNISPFEILYWNSSISETTKTFTIDLIGEVESGITWNTDSDLGSIKPNQPSTIGVNATSLLYGGRVAYELVEGVLPPGLGFLPSNGIIEGKVKQFADIDGPGLTRFYEVINGTNNFSSFWDGSTTTFDKKFTFTIKARDSVNFSEVLKSFSLTVVADNAKTFANLFVKAFQSKEKRLEWYNFITDANTFVPTELYRYGDVNFSVQTEIKMLVYSGIESTTAVKYVQAMSRNHYRKRLKFGGLKSAQAKDPITQKTIYEVVYVEIIDDLEKDISSNNNPGSTLSISNTVQLSNTINSPVLISYDAIRIDSDIPLVSDRDHQRVFPNSIKNMRKRIQGVGDRDREFLPLWMRSIQDKDSRETGFVKALVLCYVNPPSGSTSYSENIINRIKAKIRDDNFDFRVFDFEIDRYLIDIINGEIQDKYLAFPQRKEKLP